MHSSRLNTGVVSAFFVAVAGASVLPRAAADTFSLFAYGDGIGGLPVFYDDGKEELSSPLVSRKLNPHTRRLSGFRLG